MARTRSPRRLKGGKHKTAVLHGNRSQSQRVKALDGFRDGSVQILVATDIAARGIDVAGVTHVINYDVPRHPEDYVHRIGRTGRAQQIGDAFTLLSGAEDADAARDIERFIGAKVPRKNVEGFNYSAMTSEPASPGPVRRERPRFGGGGGGGRHRRAAGLRVNAGGAERLPRTSRAQVRGVTASWLV